MNLPGFHDLVWVDYPADGTALILTSLSLIPESWSDTRPVALGFSNKYLWSDARPVALDFRSGPVTYREGDHLPGGCNTSGSIATIANFCCAELNAGSNITGHHNSCAVSLRLFPSVKSTYHKGIGCIDFPVQHSFVDSCLPGKLFDIMLCDEDVICG